MSVRKWLIDDSKELYNILAWGAGYFDVNNKGNIVVKPRANDFEIDLKEVIDELESRNISMPVLVRFPDIVDQRIESLSRCFAKSTEEYEFKGNYYSVFPIKVNQNQPVVKEIMKHGKKFNIGLEAGSKPELHAVLASTTKSDALIICNGYKDEAFIELALLAQKMGKRIFLVVEKLNELIDIINISKRLKVNPNIGIRIKLASSGSGKWENSGGDQSKFGLNSSELLEALNIAKENNFLSQIKLLHFHIGSQVTKIRMIKNALREASQFYVQMMQEGCSIEFVDIGGGLGIDYDGTKSSSQNSINYSIQEYANDAVFMFSDASEKNNLSHPDIITESGRSLTAHHSVLIFNVLEKTSLPQWDFDEDITEGNHELVQELFNIFEKLSTSNMLESWHDAQEIREEALDLFSLGLISLKTRALTERLFWSVAKEIYTLSANVKHISSEFRNLPKNLADKYFCNFSIFQSLPDAWAIDQVFPVMPIHRLNEKPSINATIQDITCDSDGKIDNFIGARNLSQFISLHELKKNEPYYIGVFLVGAYQEILGDLHNLFGDTNTVHIVLTNDGYEIEKIIDGETVSEVLGYVQYNTKSLVRKIDMWVSASVKSGKISSKEGKEFLENYRSGLYGYTYLT